MSSKIQGITVEIGGDTTKLGKALEGVNSSSKKLQSELKGVNTLLKMDPSNVTLLKQKQELLNQSISECTEKLKILKSTQEQVQNQFEKGEITAEQYRDFQREIVSTESKLKNLKEQAKEFGSVGAQQVAQVGEKMQDLGGKVEDTGKKMLKVTGVVAAGGAAAIAVGASFDDAMKQVAATMGITVEEIENGSKSYKILEDAAKKCGEETKFSASESAQALNYLALAGYDAKKSAETLPKVLNLAAAGGMDLATASDMVTDAMAALGMETSELDKYIDEMAKTSQKSNTSVSQLGEATLTCAGTVKMANMSLETMNVELGVLANNGIKGAEGGTHLRNIILSLTSPSDKASEALKSLGISVLDSQGNVRDLNDIMTDFNTELDGLSDGKKTEIISTIFNKTDISAVNALIKGSGDEFANLKNQISNCDGAAADMADTMNSSLSGQATLLKSQLEGMGIQISQILMPVLKKIIDKISEILNWVSKLSPTAKTILVIISGIVAAIGPLLIIIGKLMSSVGAILTYGLKILSAFGAIKGAVSGLFSLVAANPVILVIVAIVAAIILLWNKCEWFRNLVMKLFEGIKNALNKAWQEIKKVWDEVQPYFIAIWEKIKSSIKPVMEAVMKAFSTAWDAIKKVWEMAKPYFEKIWEAIKVVFSVYIKALGVYFKTLWNVIKVIWDVVVPFFINVWNGIKNGLEPIIKAIGEAFKAAWELIKTIWNYVQPYFNAIWEAIKLIFSVAKEVLGAYFKLAWEYIKVVWDVAVKYFTMIWENIKAVFSVVATVVGGFFKTAWENIKLVWDTVTSYFEAIFNSIKLIFSAVTSVLHGDFSGAWEAIKGVVDTWKGYFEGVWNNIKGVFANVAGYFSSVFQSAYNAVTTIFGNIGTFFSGIWETVKNTFSTIGTTIGNTIGESFKNCINAIINFAQNTINGFIRSINNVIGAINNIPGVSIGTISELNLPKLKVGMANVPYDNYLALLHKGERVLTAKQNQEYSPHGNDENYAESSINRLNNLLGEYLPKINDNTQRQRQLVLDTGVLVGETKDVYDEALARNYNAGKRGR